MVQRGTSTQWYYKYHIRMARPQQELTLDETSVCVPHLTPRDRNTVLPCYPKGLPCSTPLHSHPPLTHQYVSRKNTPPG